MSKSLFLKLVEVNPKHRYTGNEALRHPFITRRIYDDIPLTFIESWNKREVKDKFKEVNI
jgi:hypothetical protein